MRELFPGYYRPTTGDFNRLWDDCLFVLDANVLLNFYRYSTNLRNTLITILEHIQNRLWIPHQAALEFHENRQGEISKQEEAYGTIKSLLIRKRNEVQGELGTFSKHISINISEINSKFNKFIDEILVDLEQQRESHPNVLNIDEIDNKLDQLFHEKVGQPYDMIKLNEVYAEGKQRYERELPPGFKDSKNKRDKKTYFQDIIIENQYGDLILWNQTIQKAKNTQKPIIFITDDVKSDWWNRPNGKIIGPHPQLVFEMKSKANVLFYMYQTEQFIKIANEFFLLNKSDQSLQEATDEVQRIRESNEQITTDSKYYKKISYSEDELNTYYNKEVQLNNSLSRNRNEETLKRSAFRSMYIDKLCIEYGIENEHFCIVWQSIDSDDEFREMFKENQISTINKRFTERMKVDYKDEGIQKLVNKNIITSELELTPFGLQLITDILFYIKLS